MKLLFHLTKGQRWEEVPHEENLRAAREVMRSHGGVAEEVVLTRRENTGEPDPLFVTRHCEERAVAVETTIEALANWAAYGDYVIHIVPWSQWEDSSVGQITHRIFVSDPTEARETGGAWH